MTPNTPTPAPVPTPRTDAEAYEAMPCHYDGHTVVNSNFARTLERELAQAKAEVVRLQEFELDATCIGRDLHDYCKDLKADRSRRLPTMVVTMIGNLRDRAEKAESELTATKAALAEAVKDIATLAGVIDRLWNHNEAVRAAVIKHYGLHHSNRVRDAIDAARTEREGGRP